MTSPGRIMNQPESFRDFPQKNEPTLSFSRIKRGSFFFVLLSAVGFTYITAESRTPIPPRTHIFPCLLNPHHTPFGRRLYTGRRTFPYLLQWPPFPPDFAMALHSLKLGEYVHCIFNACPNRRYDWEDLRAMETRGRYHPGISGSHSQFHVDSFRFHNIFSRNVPTLLFKIYKGILAQIIQPSLAILSIAIFFILTALVFPALSIKFIVFILKILPISHTRRNHFVYRCIRAILRVHRDFMTITRSQNIYYGFHGCSML